MVFHIVLSNPYVGTDEVVRSQIDAMNTDFAGLNPDTPNSGSFHGVRGHSLSGLFWQKEPFRTVDKWYRKSFKFNTTGDPNNVIDSIKRKSLGGADAWDPKFVY